MLRDYQQNPIKITKNGKGSEKPYKEDLEYLYLDLNYSVNELVIFFNTSKPTIERWLNFYNIHKNQELKLLKIKETCIQKYGMTHYNNRTKAKNTCLNRYGVSNVSQNKFVQIKKRETMKKNNSYNISKKENYIFSKLLERYKTIIRQYKSSVYPYHCDFYIPEIDTYIEYQGFFTHGKEPYIGSKEQEQIINLWKSKNTKFYNNAIINWTKTDVVKRNMARKNNLKWFEFFNINQFDEWLKNQ